MGTLRAYALREVGSARRPARTVKVGPRQAEASKQALQLPRGAPNRQDACPMTWMRKLTGARWSRPTWGVLTLITAALLAGSFALSSGALRNAESDARSTAVDYTNAVLLNALTPEEVQSEILKADYRKLIIAVQGEILSDPAVARLRLWQLDGTLIFSSDQRDKIGEPVGLGNSQIQAAGQGETESLVTEARVAPKVGLAGSNEKLYETFVPLRLGGAVDVAAVAQIDQRYSFIQEEAYRFWRPAQWALGGAFAIFLLLLWASLFTKPARARVAAGAGVAAVAGERPEHARADEQRMGQLEEHLDTSERQLHETLQAGKMLENDLDQAAQTITRLEAENKRLRVAAGAAPGAAAAGAAATTTAALEAAQLTERLKGSEEERERAAGELQRLKAALAAKEADLALAQVRVTSGEAESTKLEEAVRGAEERAARGETRAKEAEQRANEAQVRANEAEARANEAEAARGALETEASKTKDAREKKAAAELKKAKQEAEKAALRVAEVEALLTEHQAKVGSLETSAKAAEEARKAASDELEKMRASHGDTQAEVTRLTDALAAKEAELERKIAEQAAVTGSVGGAEEQAAKAAELTSHVRELEDQRRQGVEDLARAEERLGNTQLELMRATKRAKELEQRLRELEAGEAAPPGERASEPEPEPAPTSPLARLRREVREAARAPAEEPAPVPAEEPAPGPAEEPRPVDEAGLSLRERLARAAAARHRAPGSGGSEG